MTKKIHSHFFIIQGAKSSPARIKNDDVDWVLMSDASPIPLYPGSDLLGEYPAAQGVDRVYGTADLLPKVVNFYQKHLGQPQELDARGLNLTEETIMPQLSQMSWVVTRPHNQTITYYRLGLTQVISTQVAKVMGANQEKISVTLGKPGYRTLICIGQKTLPQITSLTL